MKKWISMCALGAVAFAAGSAQAVLVDFNQTSDMGEFIQIRSAAPSNTGLALVQNAAFGVGTPASGGVEKTDIGGNNNNNDIAAVYAAGGLYSNAAISFSPGEVMNLSLKFKTGIGAQANLAATPRLGIAGITSVNTLTTNGTVTDTPGTSGRFIFGGNNNSSTNNPTDSIALSPSGGNAAIKDLQAVSTEAGNVSARQVFGDTLDDALMVEDSWYEMSLSITKTNTADTFNIIGELNLLNGDGTTISSLVQQVIANSVVIPNLYADSQVVAGFSWTHNGGTPESMAAQMDDFSVEVVPEPATLALLGLGGLGLLRHRRG